MYAFHYSGEVADKNQSSNVERFYLDSYMEKKVYSFKLVKIIVIRPITSKGKINAKCRIQFQIRGVHEILYTDVGRAFDRTAIVQYKLISYQDFRISIE